MRNRAPTSRLCRRDRHTWRTRARLFAGALTAALLVLARCTCQAAGAPCDNSSDCLATEVCAEAYCRAACNSTAECGATEVCIDGACLPARDVPGADASLPDVAAPDRAAADTLPPDGALRDIAPADSAPADSAPADAARADLTASDTLSIDAPGTDAPGTDRTAFDRTALDSSGGVDTQHDDRGEPDTPADAGPRAVGDACLDDVQCESGFCHPVDGTCQLPSCSDGFQNQDETGVDCGGIRCPPCPTCWGNAANFDALDPGLDFSAAVDISGCSPTINTALPPGEMLINWCGPEPTPVIQTQSGGPGLVVVPMASLLIGAGQILRLIGDKPVVLAVRGDATVFGIIDAGAQGIGPGAGGDQSTDGTIATAGEVTGTGDCSVFAAGTGQGMNREPGWFSLGGGGAGFRTNGGFGGGERPNFRCYSNPGYTQVADGYECQPLCPDLACDNSFNDSVNWYQANNGAHYAVAPVYGLAAPDQSLTPLRGGCAGGRGETRDSATAYYGGSGGGAVQLSASGTLTIGAGGIVSAGGGGGTVVGSHGSGSGGGSGGAILLEATVVDVSAAAGIRAHGGSGGGRDGGGGCSTAAESGHLVDDSYATHSDPAECVGEGRGGLSHWDVGNPACNGTNATIGAPLACTLPVADWPASTTAYPQGGDFRDNNGGGGGGGSGGVIIVRRLASSGACR